MHGGPSHVDTFDYKPKLDRRRRQGRSAGPRSAAAKLLGSPLKFAPARPERAVDLASCSPSWPSTPTTCASSTACTPTCRTTRRRSCRCTPAASSSSRPSLGAWMLYGLGTENENLPGFITLNPPADNGGAQNYGSAFLPGRLPGHADRRRRPAGRRGAAISNIAQPASSTARPAARQLDLRAGAQPRAARARAASTPSSRASSSRTSWPSACRRAVPEADGPRGRDRPRRWTLYGIDEQADRRLRPPVPAGPPASSRPACGSSRSRHGGWDHHRNLKDALDRELHGRSTSRSPACSPT